MAFLETHNRLQDWEQARQYFSHRVNPLCTSSGDCESLREGAMALHRAASPTAWAPHTISKSRHREEYLTLQSSPKACDNRQRMEHIPGNMLPPIGSECGV